MDPNQKDSYFQEHACAEREVMRYKNHYQLEIIEDIQKDADYILKVLSDIHNGVLPCDIKLLNYYRQVPVSYHGKITNILSDGIEMDVHQNQAVVMKHEKQVLLKCEYFPKGFGVHAFVAMSNIQHCRATLNRFAYAQIQAQNRGTVRVEIDFPLEGVFTSSAGNLAGNVVDISVTGICLKLQDMPMVESLTEGRFACAFPGGSIDLPAKLLIMAHIEDSMHAVITIKCTGTEEMIISRFIFAQQVAIIQELKDHYLG